jgi:hypothetical protein
MCITTGDLLVLVTLYKALILTDNSLFCLLVSREIILWERIFILVSITWSTGQLFGQNWVISLVVLRVIVITWAHSLFIILKLFFTFTIYVSTFTIYLLSSFINFTFETYKFSLKHINSYISSIFPSTFASYPLCLSFYSLLLLHCLLFTRVVFFWTLLTSFVLFALYLPKVDIIEGFLWPNDTLWNWFFRWIKYWTVLLLFFCHSVYFLVLYFYTLLWCLKDLLFQSFRSLLSNSILSHKVIRFAWKLPTLTAFQIFFKSFIVNFLILAAAQMSSQSRRVVKLNSTSKAFVNRN